MSSLSSTSDASSRATDPRVQRIIRSDSFAGSNRPLKRAPSFGGSSRNSLDSVAMSIDHSTKDSDVTSSDEEEKTRTRKAKKARTKATSPTPFPATPLMSPHPSKVQQRPKPKLATKASPVTSKPTSTVKSPESASPHPAKRRATVKRNLSILGPELPNPQPNLEPPASVIPTYSPPRSLSSTLGSNSPYHLNQIPAFSPGTTSPATSRPLRRSKPSASIPRLAPARIIAFGDISPTSPEKPGAAAGLGLGSAFQLN